MEREPIAPTVDHQELSAALRVLGTSSRLAILSSLSFPRSIREILVQPTRTPQGHNPERPMSTQAVRKHVDRLLEMGLVREEAAPAEAEERTRYVIDRPRVFALAESFADLARLYGGPGSREDPTNTLQEAVVRGPLGPGITGPRFVLAHGAYEGEVFPLTAETRREGRWSIGRRPGASIVLDYDPFVSRHHAYVDHKGGVFHLVDATENRNGTRVNWQPVPSGTPHPLAPGDIVGIGRSTLVFQTA